MYFLIAMFVRSSHSVSKFSTKKWNFWLSNSKCIKLFVRKYSVGHSMRDLCSNVRKMVTSYRYKSIRIGIQLIKILVSISSRESSINLENEKERKRWNQFRFLNLGTTNENLLTHQSNATTKYVYSINRQT